MASRLRTCALVGVVWAPALLLLLPFQSGMTPEDLLYSLGQLGSSLDDVVDRQVCSPPAERFDLPPKGCPPSGSCVARNHDFSTFQEAWVACGKFAECGVIMLGIDGKYKLRRDSDPDYPRTAGGTSMLFQCVEQTTATTTWTGSVFVMGGPTITRTTTATPTRPPPRGPPDPRKPVRKPTTAPTVQAVKHNRRCKAANPKLDGLITRILCSNFTQQWSRCALVGGSLDFQSKGMGPQIDAHDTVIRVNRLPTPKYAHDFGNRTDVLFAGAKAESRAMYNLAGQFYRLMGGAYDLCEFTSPDCPFKALVLKGADSSEFHQSWDAQYPIESPGWRPKKTKWPLGFQSDAANVLAYDLLDGSRPTNGFHAFLTFMLVCDSLDVYGFSGDHSADGHAVSSMHKLSEEHRMMAALAEGRIPTENKRGKKFANELVDLLKFKKDHVQIIHA